MLKPYIKTNPLVAADCGLTGIRTQSADGNFILFKRDLLRYGTLYQIDHGDVLERVGGVAMTSAEAAEEYRGTRRTTLPEPSDERFRLPSVPEESDTDPADDQTQEGGEG